MRDTTDDEKRRIEEIRRVALGFRTPEPRSTAPFGRPLPWYLPVLRSFALAPKRAERMARRRPSTPGIAAVMR